MKRFQSKLQKASCGHQGTNQETSAVCKNTNTRIQDEDKKLKAHKTGGANFVTCFCKNTTEVNHQSFHVSWWCCCRVSVNLLWPRLLIQRHLIGLFILLSTDLLHPGSQQELQLDPVWSSFCSKSNDRAPGAPAESSCCFNHELC